MNELQIRQLQIAHAKDEIRCCKELNQIRFHDLRHTHATLMLRNGIPAKVVSSMFGHSSIQLTMDTYSHVLPDMQEGAVSAMDKLLNSLW